MTFAERYISTTEKEKQKDSKKIVISDDMFAQCEVIEGLTRELKKNRISKRL